MNLAAYGGDPTGNLLCVNFNQDCSSLAVGSKSGYKLFSLNSVEKLEEIYEYGETEDICIVERLFSSSLVAIVSLSAPRKLKVCHFKKGTEICNYSYPNTILAVRLNRVRLLVVLEESLYIHNIRDMKVLHTIRDTPPNPSGLCSLSVNSDNCFLGYPGSNQIGEVQIFDCVNLRAVTMIPAHDSPVAAMGFNSAGTKLSTASEKGTVIRVFSIPDGQKLYEFRRGVKRCVTIFSLAFSHDSLFLCASSNTETVHIFKLEAPKKEPTDEAGGFMGYFGKALSPTSYLPVHVAEVFNQERAFASVRLPQAGLRNVCAISMIGKLPRLLVSSADGYLYIYNIDPEEGGDCTLLKQHRLIGQGEGLDKPLVALIQRNDVVEPIRSCRRLLRNSGWWDTVWKYYSEARFKKTFRSFTHCVRLGKEEEALLRQILHEFESNPEDGRYDRTIETRHSDPQLIPKIFIWCPIRHYDLTINCPVHNCPLRVGRWTDVLQGIRTDPRNPRLVYDLHGNLVLVQAFYECSYRLPEHEKAGHRYLSACNEMLGLLSPTIDKMFPIIMQQRCAFTTRLYDYIITSIYQGQNFMELSEGIASMNFREFMRNNPESDDLGKGFESNIFCAYPGNDKLMELFLLQFQLTRDLYENNMCKHVGKILSCDHTFKISKHVGVTREDDCKFVRQFENVFLALNENGEVMTWAFTKSTSFSEISGMLKDLKCRLDEAGITLEMILVDDCCHVRQFYEQIFPGVKVRLDLFHACLRIVQTIPKGNSFNAQFSNELSLIFRNDGDLGDERKMATASPEDVEANLERLLFVWKKNLNKDTLHQAELLRKHIRKGCLSDIPIGFGTEKNERLHRHLNRSLLCGVSKIGPELAIAVMTCVLYAWNCKRKGSHLQSKRVKPVVPIESVRSCHQDHVSTAQPHMKQTKNKILSSDIKGSSISASRSYLVEKKVEELKTITLLEYIIRRVLHLQDFLSTFGAQCKTKTVDMVSLLWSTGVKTSSFIEDESELNTMGMDMTSQHAENLKRNLSGLNLELDKVAEDGNCYFRAVVRHLPKYLTGNKEQLEQHCLSLGFGKNEGENTAKLRQLFVNEVTEHIGDYKSWMTAGINNLEMVSKFSQSGFFASEVGDLCARATAKLLRIPIFIVTALPNLPTIPFLPDVFATDKPIYVAYDHSGPGHYNATKGTQMYVIMPQASYHLLLPSKTSIIRTC